MGIWTFTMYLMLSIRLCIGRLFPMPQMMIWEWERYIRYRGFYEVEYPDIPYPEVVSYAEDQDGTVTLLINAVYPDRNTAAAFSHRTVIRPLSEGCFQYVSNQMISPEEYDIRWHSDRLTKEEWLEIYGGTE